MPVPRDIKQQSETAIRAIDNYLTYMGAANQPLDELDGAYVLTPEIADSPMAGTLPMCYMGAQPDDLNGIFRVNVLGEGVEEAMELCAYTVASMHWSEVAKLRVRSKRFGTDLDRYTPEHVARLTETSIYRSGRVAKRDTFMGWCGRTWRVVHDPLETPLRDGLLTRRWDKQCPRTTHLSLGIAYMEPALWLAKVGVDGSPSLSLPTDPTGIKALFAMRDLPEGKSRRDALLHWVAEHWRQSRHDPDLEVYVRAHLRGCRTFKTTGFRVNIQESAEDIVRIRKLTEERLAMRLTGVSSRKRRAIEKRNARIWRGDQTERQDR